MRLEITDPAFYGLTCRGIDIHVDRKSLREAGLENAFLEKVGTTQ